jgi:hypothetical protein
MAGSYHLCIRPSRGFKGPDFVELWNFRGLLGALAVRDIKLRYRQTALGVAWVMEPFGRGRCALLGGALLVMRVAPGPGASVFRPRGT